MNAWPNVCICWADLTSFSFAGAACDALLRCEPPQPTRLLRRRQVGDAKPTAGFNLIFRRYKNINPIKKLTQYSVDLAGQDHSGNRFPDIPMITPIILEARSRPRMRVDPVNFVPGGPPTRSCGSGSARPPRSRAGRRRARRLSVKLCKDCMYLCLFWYSSPSAHN
jgi:hypothetical protein